MSLARLSLLLLLVVTGCSSSKDDPFTADMKMICNAGSGRSDLPPAMAQMEAMREIASKIRTPEAARLMAAVVQAAPADKAALIAPALAKAKLSRCPLLTP